MTTLSVKVSKICHETADIKSFRLVSAFGAPLPEFTAGSHVDVHVHNGLVRQYSLCNGPDERDCYLIAVKREPDSRGGSQAMHALKEGDIIDIGVPRNNFALDSAATHHVLLGGGIGITPLLSMAKLLAAQNASFELHYYSRSVSHTAFYELLAGDKFSRFVHFHHGLQPEDMRVHLGQLLERREWGEHLYLCGPRPFMDMIVNCAKPAWPSEAVHLEYFAADQDALNKPQDEFQIRLARSGVTYSVPPGIAITEVLASHGRQIETSCEQGVCGTCLTGVLEGVPDHRDVFLNDTEKEACDKMLPCVSRAKTNLLVLDL
ncbi:PDR/VanB family oxidoreductase [Herbaspirillum sp. GCM10030257]|uniref:PDR/VanB family oxidoreductase n=1 Tax=Herbaspirillum sp. GCM10030257 TaxID=3273393 RepID=UPI00361ADDCD